MRPTNGACSFPKQNSRFFNPNLADFSTMADQWVTCEEVIGGSDWQQVSFNYTASDDFEYAYIGYMGNVSTSSYVAENEDFLLGFYVWIDMVVVERVEPQLSLSPDVTICKGENTLLEASSNFPVMWTDAMSGETAIVVEPEHTTVYYVETLDSTACSIRDSIVVTVVGDEEIDFTDVSICEGSDAFILSPGITGNWSGAGIIDSNSGLFDPSLSGTGEHIITYNSDTDCSENFSLFLEVLEPPLLDFDADIVEGCPPMEVKFTDLSPLQGNNYEWDFGTGATSNETITTAHIYTEPGFYDVNLKVDYSDHCSAMLTVEDMIQVFDPPVADFTYAPLEPSNLDPGVQFTNSSSDDVNQWLWDFGDGSSSNQNNPFHTFSSSGIYEVSLTATSIHACSDSISQQVTVHSMVNFFIPNVFSPNYDGINDEFSISPFGPIEDFNLRIFNRWGGLVFESKQLDNKWDGKLPDGKKAEEGVYVYLIEYTYSGLNPGEPLQGKTSGDILILK